MLVLSRKVDEAIVVGGAVSLRILEIRGKTVRVGIDAPAEIEVHREEVFARLERSFVPESTATGEPIPGVRW